MKNDPRLWSVPFKDLIQVLQSGYPQKLFHYTDNVVDCCKWWAQDVSVDGAEEIVFIRTMNNDSYDITDIYIVDLSPDDILFQGDLENFILLSDKKREFSFTPQGLDIIYNYLVDDDYFMKNYLTHKSTDKYCDTHEYWDWMPKYDGWNKTWQTVCYDFGFSYNPEETAIYMDIYAVPGKLDENGECEWDCIESVNIDSSEYDAMEKKYFYMGLFEQKWKEYSDWVIANKKDPLNMLKLYDYENNPYNDEDNPKNLHLKELVRYTKIEVSRQKEKNDE